MGPLSANSSHSAQTNSSASLYRESTISGLESMESNGDGTVHVEVYDETSGEYRTFEMDED